MRSRTPGKRVACALIVGLVAGSCALLAWNRDNDDNPTPGNNRQSDPVGTQNVGDSSNQRSPIHLTLMTDAAGIDFQHVSGNSDQKPFPAANGSGVGTIDYDLDGRYDLFFATGQPFPLSGKPGQAVHRFYRNLGQWKFEDVTGLCGLPDSGYSAGVAVGDFDSDGFPDLYVTCIGANRMYRNLGDGTFQDVSESSGSNDEKWATSAAFLDYDSDGLLDIYVCNYAKWNYEDRRFCGNQDRGVRIFCSPRSVQPESDRLFRNLGDGTFGDVTDECQIGSRPGRAQGVLAADVNHDGLIDLYVGNDLHPNSLFINDGQGRFLDASEQSGVAYSYRGTAQAGMGVAGADVNRDGHWDLFVTNFEREYNTLYLNNQAAIFADQSRSAGLADGSRPWIGWGTAFVDFDLDGWKDLIVTNGNVDDNLEKLGRDAQYSQPAIVWHNRDGMFHQLGGVVGSYFQLAHPGRGLATVDLDNDGDTDVVVTQQDQRPALLRNDCRSASKTGRGSISIKLIGTSGNRDAVGASLRISDSTGTRIEQIQGGGSYLSAHDLRRIIATTTPEEQIQCEVFWPGGVRSSISGMKSGGRYVIIEPRQETQSSSALRLLRE
jgi:hypothetical protein